MKIAITALACALPAMVSVALDRPATPATYRAVLGQLAPGDRMLLAAGTYEGLPITSLSGAAGMPIIITGPESGAPAIIGARSCCNTVSIRNSAYVTLRHVEIDGRGELVDAIKAEGDAMFAHHITIEHVRMHSFGNDQQIVGISTKCPAWDWVIRSVTIDRPGTGLYLGDSTGDAPFVRGLIENNLIVDAIGYDAQIKHQNPRPATAGMPTADSVTIIRDNVFVKATRASTGDEARPNLLVGHWPVSGPGQNDRYEIYGNYFHENASLTEALFQGEGNVAFHDNVLFNSLGPGLLFRAQNGEVRDVSVYNNTIYAFGRGIAISGGAAGTTQPVVGNAVFASSPTPIQGGAQSDNFETTLGLTEQFVVSARAPLDFYPRAGTTLEGSAIDLTPFSNHVDFDRDFNGTPKTRRFRGAYSGSGTNPGWALAQAIKTRATVSVSDAGPSLTDVMLVGIEPDAAMDASVEAQPDARVIAPVDDAGVRAADAGVRAADAGVRADDAAAADMASRRVTGSCACTGTREDLAGGMVLLLAAMFVARRRG